MWQLRDVLQQSILWIMLLVYYNLALFSFSVSIDINVIRGVFLERKYVKTLISHQGLFFLRISD